MAFEYLESLNPEQKAAVVHTGSPLLILAGAGSGKTRVITTKIAYLIQHENIKSWQILAVTFTKKAADEMRERAVALEPLASDSQIKTFHSFGAWFLRKFSDFTYLDRSFTVYDDTDSASLIQKALPHLTKKQAYQAAKKIALCKDYCLTPDDDISDFDEDGDLQEIYRAYQKRLMETGNADFGDLIMLPVLILEQNPEIRKQMQYHFKVVMVDEYQDSNVAQFRLLQALCGLQEGSGTYLCVVGDDDQSIYKFRGAEIQNILQFPNIFPGTQLIRLERNYRSTASILHAADAVVKNNSGRIGKTLIAEGDEGEKPDLIFLENQDAEAKFCAKLIKDAVASRKNPASYSDFAVLYRTNAQSLEFEHEFLNTQIPYKVVGSLKFYEREEIKDLLSYLSLIANGRDEIAFRRVANKPSRGLGEKSLEKIIVKAYEKRELTGESQNLISALGENAGELSKKASEGAKDFYSLMKNLTEELEKNSEEAEEETEKDENFISSPLSYFIERLSKDSGLEEYHKAQDILDGTSRRENMQKLANYGANFPATKQGLLDFLDTINLDRTLSDDSEDEEKTDAVTLITLHNTKGLEYNRVIITGLENGVFPREDKTGSDLEEERRLFYVGITRARKSLTVTSCRLRRLYGKTQFMTPSIFLREAEEAFEIQGRNPFSSGNGSSYSYGSGYSTYGNGGYGSYYQKQTSLSQENDPIKQKYAKGTKIYHDEYGYGIVSETNDKGDEYVITVQFESGYPKKFIPKYQQKSLQVIKD